jgi:hypothetical protein
MERRGLMKFLTEKDKKRNFVLFILLGFSLLLVPFSTNPGIRMVLTIFLLALFLNTLVIVGKSVHWIRKKKG